ncbi:MAG: 23S rRNA (adenine(2503)-C(2))-methyltransferase RlmN [Desulfobacterales bacterium]
MASSRTDIINCRPEEVSAWLTERGFEPYRAKQIFKWIFTGQTDDFSAMTNLSKRLRSLLEDAFAITRLTPAETAKSADGSIKHLFQLSDGELIETVLIAEKNHFTLCISSQAGCALGCTFCRTGQGGLIRNLTRGEILAQVRDTAFSMHDPERLTNIVFMGMGEPLANYENVVSAANTLMSGDSGLNFSSRRVTISTAGIASKIIDLGRDTSANPAVSLNAADDETRDLLMPINRTFPIAVLLDACRKYPLPARRRITFEYILIRNVNDSPKDAQRLAKLLHGIKAKINLIPFNAHEGSDFERPPESVISQFQDVLLSRNYTAVIRRSKGEDIMGACGQLRATGRFRQHLIK